jgi:hypothetical protein
LNNAERVSKGHSSNETIRIQSTNLNKHNRNKKAKQLTTKTRTTRMSYINVFTVI